MKLKRIIAGMAAAVMAFSTMSIGASADDKGWTLHYYDYYPSNANRYVDEITFNYGYITINTYSDRICYFNKTTNNNGSVPYISFSAYVVNLDGTGAQTTVITNKLYYADNNLDNNINIERAHIDSPFSLSTVVTPTQKLVVKHYLHNVTKNTYILGKGNGYHS